MIELEFLEGLIRALDESSLDSVDIERGGTRIRLSKTAPPSAPVTQGVTGSDAAPLPETEAAPTSPAVEAEPAASNLVDVKSPMVGDLLPFGRSRCPFLRRAGRTGE